MLYRVSQKMPQSGVGSIQESKEDCLPMKGHTRGGGDAPTIYPDERTPIFSQGGTHLQCNPTNGNTILTKLTKLNKRTDKAIYILRQHAALKTRLKSKMFSMEWFYPSSLSFLISKFWAQKKFRFKRNVGSERNFGSKSKFGPEKMWGQKKMWGPNKKLESKKYLGSKRMLSPKKMLGPK